ncbi:MAG: hypothetical protein GYB42_09430 [Alphaproteobacteria bacterium]|jgi:hypothetical protein|nr:hypothetical protein [Alphaproteobacteria bacterium]
MQQSHRTPNRRRLFGLSLFALGVAALGIYLFWQQIGGADEMNWVWYLMLATLGAIIYGTTFFFSVLAFENTLEQYIVSDKITKKNKWIDVETETRSSHDDKVDGWVKIYVFARTMFAMGLLPLLACIYLFFIY